MTLSARLDAQTREVMQQELGRICRATKPTVVFVTHDIWEAVLLADRVITMTAGPAARIKTIETVDSHRRRVTRPTRKPWHCMAGYGTISA